MTQKKFEKMRREKQYVELGWHFWKVFLTTPKKSARRILASRQYDSLSRREKKLVESV